MSTKQARTWFAVPGWWLPVWVSLDGGRGGLDPLEQAVRSFVAWGSAEPAWIADRLAVDRSLVESAIHSLLGRGCLTAGESGLVVVEQEDEDAPTDREGWVAWDSVERRPLFQILLGAAAPPETPPEPPGWAVERLSGQEQRPSRPSQQRVDRMIRLLPHANETRLYERIGLGLSEVEASAIRSIRRKLDVRPRYGAIWIPTEHRIQGSAVWRPVVAPMAQVPTELDAGGWAGLQARLTEDRQADAEGSRRAVRDEVMPGVVKAMGFESVSDLTDWSRRRAQAELGGAWRVDGGALEEAVVDAFRQEKVGEALERDANSIAGEWTIVLELLTKRLIDPVRDRLGEQRGAFPQPRSGQKRRIVMVLGPSWDHLSQALREDERLGELTERMRTRTDTIGTRAVGLAAACLLDGDGLARAERLDEALPSFFVHLGRGLKERNTLTHPDEEKEPVSLAGFRTRVLKLCKAASGL